MKGNYCSVIFILKKRACLLLSFFLFIITCTFSQNKQRIDSLESIYALGNYEEQDKLIILNALALNHSDPDKKLIFSEELLENARAMDSLDYLFLGFLFKGYALSDKGDFSEALETFYQAAEIADNEDVVSDQGKINAAIADVYSLMGNHENAIEYYRKSIVILRKENDSLRVATALYNTGDAYFIIKKYDSAIAYFNESSLIFKNIDYLLGTAFNLGSIGMIYAEQGKYELAKKNINQALIILEKYESYDAISEFLISLSDIYAIQNDFSSAFSTAQKSLVIAQKYGFKKHVSDANLKLSELYDQTGNQTESFKHYKNYIVYRDSVKNIEAVQEMADLRTDYQVSQKQLEVDLLNTQKRNQKILVIATAIALFLIGLLALGLFRRNKYIYKTNQVIEKERNRSDNLLLNILPEATAHQLKENGEVQAEKFESVTVLFTDFEGFTNHSENLPPEKLVESVDFYFSKFDEIMDKYDLEKIKTIGDSYMCAGGLPVAANDHAFKMIQAALEITKFVKEAKLDIENDLSHFEIRIGINSGPVVAGVVGIKKFAYDIWGDTVNVASRMEAASVAGKINISENTFQLIKNDFDCRCRGEIEVKNKGRMKMYFVEDKQV